MDKIPDLIAELNEKSKLEVHIIKNQSRHDVNARLLTSNDFNLKVGLAEMLTLALSNKSLLKYFKLVSDANLKHKFIEQNATLGSETDLEQIFNFYMTATYRFSQECQLDKSKEQTAGQKNAALRKENLNSLIRISGGTLEQLRKISKAQMRNPRLRDVTKRNHERVYRLTLAIKMTQEEKDKGDLPVELVERDRGGMAYPKKAFYPYVTELNDTIRMHATKDGFMKHGKNLIKTCVAAVKLNRNIEKLYLEGIGSLNPEDRLYNDAINLCFKFWTRKLTHCRIQEFVSVYARGLDLGGQTLRDKLYQFAKKSQFKQNAKITEVSKKNNDSPQLDFTKQKKDGKARKEELKHAAKAKKEAAKDKKEAAKDKKEAAKAKKEAAKAKKEAAKAKKEAAKAKKEAEKAKKEAEKESKKEATKIKREAARVNKEVAKAKREATQSKSNIKESLYFLNQEKSTCDIISLSPQSLKAKCDNNRIAVSPSKPVSSNNFISPISIQKYPRFSTNSNVSVMRILFSDSCDIE